ncbi:MAG: hypothetical protein M1369_06210 [Deinococcus sp.]|nr:hypothetical protein [Deinococcus sp.]
MMGFMTANPAPKSWPLLEESPESFWESFGPYASLVEVLPEPHGSPLLEANTAFGPLFAFDRGVGPLASGNASLLFHGQVNTAMPQEAQPGFSMLQGGGYEFRGVVGAHLQGPFWLMELIPEDPAAAPFKLVLASRSTLEAGPQLVTLLPPLMAFRPENR